MKAHTGLVAIQSGVMSVLSLFEGGTDDEKKRRKPFQKFLGNMTTVVRELSSREISLEVSKWRPSCHRFRLNMFQSLWYLYLSISNVSQPLVAY